MGDIASVGREWVGKGVRVKGLDHDFCDCEKCRAISHSAYDVVLSKGHRRSSR